MSSILLAAVNSRFNHTNIAVRSICEYAREKTGFNDIGFKEFTISQPMLDILRHITAGRPGLVMFSVYIWNCTLVYRVMAELKKICPDCIIGAGGPEVSWNSEQVLKDNPALDFIMQGEGELTATEIVRLHQTGCLRSEIQKRRIFAPSSLLPDLSPLPFPYNDLVENDSRILYYESSRGCPFSCSYCLSSLDKTVRYMPLERVFADLSRFLQKKVKLVKFVDRTFNLNEKRYTAIWRFIKDNYNGVTRFHFEIAGEYLSDEALDMLKDMPDGSIQFEIGIQSIKKETLEEVGRPADIDRLSDRIRRIPPAIHRHVDLIAGLPHENMDDFALSFNYAIRLKPDMLQLGFLKVLSGTRMADYAAAHSYQMLSEPPYEVLSTPHMSWEELVFLKDVESLLDVFYNSGHFARTADYLFSTAGAEPFAFFRYLAEKCRREGSLEAPHRPAWWFQYFHGLFSSPETCSLFGADGQIVTELLRFDFMIFERPGAYPSWYRNYYDKNRHHEALLKHADMHSTRLAYAHSAWDAFAINPDTLEKKQTEILFLYPGSGETGSACKNRYVTL